MAFNHDAGRNGSVAQIQPNAGNAAPPGWGNLSGQRFPTQTPRRRSSFIIVSVLLVILIIFTVIRISSIADGANDQFTLRVADQQGATVDLRQSTPISPDVLGVNVFPRMNSTSLDGGGGFMNYTPLVMNDLQDMHIKLLRFPGGNWGEQHILSLNQLGDFSKVLAQTNADGMIQARLSGPITDANGQAQPGGVTADVNSRAMFATQWVDYMNNPNSTLRPKTDPYHPVKLWTVGNEPDLLINPLTKKRYTAAEYADAFIQFSQAMHQKDPSLKVFGPEISQFYGVGAGPFDAGHNPWMETFLQTVGTYEQQHKDLPFKILDGVSFHRYQFDNAQLAPSMVLSSTNEWDYTLPQLRALVRLDLGRDLPVGVTEVNTNPTNPKGDPSRGIASLWWADTLGSMMDQQVGYVGFFSASGVNSPYPLFTDDGLHETSMGRVMQLFSHMQHNLVPMAVQHDPISVYATQDDAHQTLSIMLINKSPSAQSVQMAPVDKLLTFSQWPSVDMSLPGYSMAVLSVHRNGGSEAYSFVEPKQNVTTVGPLAYIVCAKAGDPPQDVLAPTVNCKGE